ncbi:HAMP domain-containing sensor histidine kinase [Pseudotenacibaculum sp. MALMAid0570]|uniref:sensor histidine kinase n=1 Tax=Pseudotenacibaculum sp. MALMAid0570 TaxID=3143938 RepID=UPI0032DE4A44
MGKRIFVLIVVLMSISLIGIISVQLYWINNAIESKDAQFDNDVKKAMARASERLKLKEQDLYYNKIKPIFDSKEFLNKAEIKNYLIQQIDTVNNRKFSFGSTIIEEDFKVPLDILNESQFFSNDTIVLTRFTRRNDRFTAQLIADDKSIIDFNEKSFSKTSKFDEWINRKEINDVFNDYRNEFPIHQRISNREINTTLREELEKNNIDIDFKYGVYNNGLATKLKSGYFTIDPDKSYDYPLFKDENGYSDHTLYVNFPEKSKHILSDISYILLLSLFFIFIIIVAFSSSLYQLVKQKKISEIKTDFINNMTHEFKTPIATINLALDSIKNPKIIKDEEKVLRYIKMIRDENKRMHGQVENVLRISRLEKNQIEINKDAVDIHDLVEDAISHVNLLALDKKGTITTHFNAIQSEALANQFHMTNVMVNMLENALKYSVDPPKIDIYTESTNKNIIIKIKDEGIGMGKQAQKYIFDKFYREQKGNIHDVKGHGLGLAYVKEIIDNHHGTVFVESEKGKGSTFTVKLPLI